MAITAVTAVFDPKRRRVCTPIDPNSDRNQGALLLLVAYAEAVNEQRLRAGLPWEAWPSQRKLAEQLGTTERTIRRRQGILKELGDIVPTGRRVGRGAVVFEILPFAPVDRTPTSGADIDVRGGKGEEGETGRRRPGGRTPTPLTKDADVPSDRTPMSHEPEGNPEDFESGKEHRSAPAAADILSPDSNTSGDHSSLFAAQAMPMEQPKQEEVPAFSHGSELVAALEAWRVEQPALKGSRHEKRALRHIAALEQQLDRHLVQTLAVAK